MDPRVVKPKTPPRLIVTAVLIGLLVLGFIVSAVWLSGRGITDARMSGIIVEKQFVPQAEQQITLGREGGIKTRDKEGEHILTVEVPQKDGTKKPFYVYVPKKLYDSVEPGQQFDVGPYIVPEKK